MRASLAILGLLAPAIVPATVHAQDVREPFRIVYEAPPVCPPRADFVAQIMLWTSRAQDNTNPGVGAADPLRTFEVILRQADQGKGRQEAYDGILVLRGMDGTATRRVISSESCARAARALALMIALSLGPPADGAAAGAHPTGGLAPSPTNQPESPKVDGGVDPRPSPAQDDSGHARGTSASVSTPKRWSIGFGANGGLLMLIGSRPVPSFGAHVELHSAGPSARLSVHHGEDTIASSTVAGHFAWTWARLDGCPWRWGHVIDVRPCAVIDVGEISARGSGGATSTRRGRPWVGLGALGRVAKHWGPVSASLDVGAIASVNREAFAFAPAPVLYAIPAWIPFAGLAIGWSP